jgi:hypothetical protein
MKSRKNHPLIEVKTERNPKPVFRSEKPELIEKFYKQIINSFGYVYSAKV